MASYGSGIPFPGYANPGGGYPQQAAPGYGAAPPAGGFGMAPPPMQGAQPAADPYANAQPGTIAYAKSEGPDGIATYTPVIAQETFYQTPNGPTRGIKWVTATSSQASAAGIPAGAITTNNAAQLPQPNGMSIPPMSALPAAGSVAGGYPPESPADDYPVMRPGQSQRDYEKAVRRWEKDKRAAEKRARKEEKERQKRSDSRSHSGWTDAQDPYDITGRQEGGRPRRMSTGNGLGFERARRMSGGNALRDDELSRKLENLDMSFNTRRERRMSGTYAPSAAGGYRSRKGSVTEADRPRKISGSYEMPRQSYYPTAGAPMPGAPGGGYPPIPGGYGTRSVPGSPARPHSAFPPSSHFDDVGVPPMRGGPSPHPGPFSRSRHPSPSMPSNQLPGGYGGSAGYGRDSNPAGGYSYGVERTPYSTASAPLAGGPADQYALTTTRRPGTAAGGAGGYSNIQVPGRELNRAQPFTAFEEFFLVEDLRELLQPQPPPLPAALVPHDVMAEEWDRCMQAIQSSRSSGMDPLIDAISQWNNQFFLPRGVDISLYKGNSRRSEPPMDRPSKLRAYDESESESESSSSSSSSSESSEDDRYYSSARREQRAAKKAERKARRKERARRRRARRRQRSVSIRIRAVPLY
ncbi:hypothetical protein RhiJN_00742 [Ceratobasidium sp. AG-Ba]|nr:hypothetical protein RhiJN_00742 [Ceratobasidium sp. AG-Ba]